MVHESLNQAVLNRLTELGLPVSLINVPEIREKLMDGWVMFIRDSASEEVADIHLIEPHRQEEPAKHRAR